MNKYLIVIGLVLVLFSANAFAAMNNVCENIHVSIDNQNKYFGGNFGQEICLSGFQPNTYFVNYKNGSWTWVLHQCVQPIEENNLLRFFYCGNLGKN